MMRIKAKAQGRSVIEYLGKRPSVKRNNIIGEVLTASDFENSHKRMHDVLSTSISALLEPIDLNKETAEIQNSFKLTNSLFGLSQVGALSVGVATWSLLEQSLVKPEILSLSTAAFVSLAGYSFAQNRHTSLKSKLVTLFEDLRLKFDETVLDITHNEINMINRRIMDSVRPYSRYVRSEKIRIEKLRTECEDIITKSHGLRSRIKNS